jgi:5'-nucleotidase
MKLTEGLIGLLIAGVIAPGVSCAWTSQQERSARGHKEHDSLAARAEADQRTLWRNQHAAHPESRVRLKILGFNDFHGQLDPRAVSSRPAGGAAVLAAYLIDAASRAEDGAIIVHAGDQVGASPPISALLQDEPSITFLNLLANRHCSYRDKLDPSCNVVGTLGNHEFDEGVDEMLRLVYGGNHPEGPFLEDPYRGARFPYVSANVVDDQTGEPILPPYVIKRIKGVPIGFIGIVLKETPNIVTPTGVAGVKFLDEAETINKYVAVLKRKGVHAIVVAMHQGTSQDSFTGPTPVDHEVLGLALGPIVERLDDEVDIVVSGHTHRFTNALMENQHGKAILVTQAFSASTAYADIDVAIDPRSKDIVEKSAQIVTTWDDDGPGLHPVESIAAMVSEAAAAVQPLVERVIGDAAMDILRQENGAGESALGNLIADAQRAAMGTDIAFVNPGGIRADLAAGEVTWGDLFTVQPFRNDLVKMELTGQQIIDLLNRQWAGQPFPRVMKPSGITYTWDGKGTGDFVDDAVIVDTVLVGGDPIDLAATYTVTMNGFMAAGGDNFTVRVDGTNRVVGPVDLDALVDFVGSLAQPFGSAIEGRIRRIN